ncbi:hypothetical protein E2C01_060677 [Portunus trituberculatus]|uniref:Uncharacterized protein n=1 Tax=Portunus trituberculatus TaxID=210409 RepID=A0A5B7HC43_PORTR|nr:hypothetical protein [Portunus trituberculatus]
MAGRERRHRSISVKTKRWINLRRTESHTQFTPGIYDASPGQRTCFWVSVSFGWEYSCLDAPARRLSTGKKGLSGRRGGNAPRR